MSTSVAYLPAAAPADPAVDRRQDPSTCGRPQASA